MNRILFVPIFLTSAVIMQIAQAAEPGWKAPNSTITGEWALLEFYLRGVEQPSEARSREKIVIRDKTLSFVDLRGGPITEYEMSLNEKTREIDLKAGNTTYKGIYRLIDRKLYVSINDNPLNPRPIGFVPKKGDGCLRFTLIRK
jgi:uncharacterized protein (TIGR03067 family)